MRKKLLLLLAIVATTVVAQAATNYGFSIYGTDVTSDNYTNIRNGVTYDPATKTLTIENTTIGSTDGSSASPGPRALYNKSCQGLTVVFKKFVQLLGFRTAPVRLEADTKFVGEEGSSVSCYGLYTWRLAGESHTGSAGGAYLANGCTLTMDGMNISFRTNEDCYDPALEGEGNELLFIYNSVVSFINGGGSGGAIGNLARLHVSNSHVVMSNQVNHETAYNINVFSCTGPYVGIETENCKFSATKEAFVDNDNNIIKGRDIVITANIPESKFSEEVQSELTSQGVLSTDGTYSLRLILQKAFELNLAGVSKDKLFGIEYLPRLRRLNVSDCGLSSLDFISNNTDLTRLECRNNELTELPDFTEFPRLAYVDCRVNRLTAQAVRDAIQSLPTRSADERGEFWATDFTTGSGELNCVVPLRLINTANFHKWDVYRNLSDGSSVLMQNYVDINELNFPDANFRNYLLAQTYGSDAKLTFDEVAELTYLPIHQRNIVNLRGIEWLEWMTRLYAPNNKIAGHLDLRCNVELQQLEIYSNQLTSLDLSGLAKLSYLQCQQNKLSSITLRGNNAIRNIICYRNQIKAPAMNDFVTHLPYATGSTTFMVYDNSGLNEGNVITQGQILEARERGFTAQYYNGSTWLDYTGATDYPILIAGTQVTNDNLNGIVGNGISGSITYDPENNVLTLNNATINSNTIAIRVAYALPGIKIVLKGDNAINFNSSSKIAILIEQCDGAVIEGPGKLNINNAASALYLDSGPGNIDHRLTIRNCEIIANDPTTYSSSGTSIQDDMGTSNITIDNATLILERGYIDSGYDLQLVGCYIASPEGGHIVQGEVCAAGSQSYYTGRIEIQPIPDEPEYATGDINGDNAVDGNDLNVLINIILGKDSADNYDGRANVDNDGGIDGNDLNVLINILLGK